MLSDEQEESFIELWYERPCLYAVNSKSYSNENVKKKAADDIAEKIAISVVAIYKKTTSLHTQYSRLVKALPSGNGSAAKTSCQNWLTGHK